MLASPSRASTKYGTNDVAEWAARGRSTIERAAREVTEANGRFVEENLAVLRAAWRLATPIVAAKVVAVAKTSAVDLNDLERRMGGEGRNGNFDCV